MEPKVVRAKFKCWSESKVTDGDGFVYNYKFSAVVSGSEENKTFWKWTPSGNLELSSIRSGLFEVGKEYYLDFSLFTPVERAPVEATN